MISKANLIRLLNLKSYDKWKAWVMFHLEEEIKKTGSVTFWYDYDNYRKIKSDFHPMVEKLGYSLCYHSTFVTIHF